MGADLRTSLHEADESSQSSQQQKSKPKDDSLPRFKISDSSEETYPSNGEGESGKCESSMEIDSHSSGGAHSTSNPQDVVRELQPSSSEESLANTSIQTVPMDSAYGSPMVARSMESGSNSEASLPSLGLPEKDPLQSQCSLSSCASTSSFSIDQDADFEYPPVEPIIEHFESKSVPPSPNPISLQDVEGCETEL